MGALSNLLVGCVSWCIAGLRLTCWWLFGSCGLMRLLVWFAGVDGGRRCGLVLIIECCYACLGLVRGLWFCWFVSVGFGLVDLLLLVLIWAVVWCLWVVAGWCLRC